MRCPTLSSPTPNTPNTSNGPFHSIHHTALTVSMTTTHLCDSYWLSYKVFYCRFEGKLKFTAKKFHDGADEICRKVYIWKAGHIIAIIECTILLKPVHLLVLIIKNGTSHKWIHCNSCGVQKPFQTATYIICSGTWRSSLSIFCLLLHKLRFWGKLPSNLQDMLSLEDRNVFSIVHLCLMQRTHTTWMHMMWGVLLPGRRFLLQDYKYELLYLPQSLQELFKLPSWNEPLITFWCSVSKTGHTHFFLHHHPKYRIQEFGMIVWILLVNTVKTHRRELSGI